MARGNVSVNQYSVTDSKMSFGASGSSTHSRNFSPTLWRLAFQAFRGWFQTHGTHHARRAIGLEDITWPMVLGRVPCSVAYPLPNAMNFCKFSIPCISKALRWSSVILSGRLMKTTLTDFPLVLNHCGSCIEISLTVYSCTKIC